MALTSEEATIRDEESKIIANILQNLEGNELKEARLVSSTFDKIIMSNSDLFWKKNLMLVRIRTPYTCQKSRKEWSLLKTHSLVYKYDCPNFHFMSTNLISQGSTDFFQSSIRYTIKHLKFTKCSGTNDMLLHILSCCSRTVEHFEVRDFSGITRAREPTLFPEGRRPPSLLNLQTLILDNTNGNEGTVNAMTSPLLQNILGGTRKLKQVTFTGWNAKSCKYFVQILASLYPDHLNQMRKLELLCITEENAPIWKQYSFIKSLGSLCMPKLQKLSLRFDRPIELSPALTEDLLEDLTEGVANVIQDSSQSIEVIELINCPVTKGVINKRGSYPSLWRVTTRGCLLPNLDEDANPFYELNLRSRSSLRRRTTRPGSQRQSEISRGAEILSDADESPTEKIDELERMKIYKIVCATILCVGIIHLVLGFTFPSHIANSVEVFIHSAIAIWAMKKHVIRAAWIEFQHDERTSTEDL